VRRRAVLVGGPALLAAVTGLVLSLVAFGSPSASGSERLPVSPQMEQKLILSARIWLVKEGVNVGVGNISIVNSRTAAESSEAPQAAFVTEDHHFYGSACLTVRPMVHLPIAKPGDLYPSPLAKWPLCVVFSTTSQDKPWVVKYTEGSNCGSIGAVLRALWGEKIPVCRLGPAIYQL
jgi:hypothetical protein